MQKCITRLSLSDGMATIASSPMATPVLAEVPRLRAEGLTWQAVDDQYSRTQLVLIEAPRNLRFDAPAPGGSRLLLLLPAWLLAGCWLLLAAGPPAE